MDKSREAKIARALGWKHSLTDRVDFSDPRWQARIRQRVRELWCEERRARFIRIDIGGELAVLTLMQTRIPPHMDDYDEEGVWSTEEVAEAGAWEKALFWLAERKEK